MTTHAAVEAWLREGRPAPTPAEVELHLARCAECSRSVRERERVRGWFDTRDDFMSVEAVRAIRFHLEATARQAQRRPAPFERRGERRGERRTRLAALLVAATLLLLAAGVGLLAPWRSPSAEDREPAAYARVESLGADVRRVMSGVDELYVMDQGAARFSVARLPPGRRVVVQVGPDRVVVHGTRFLVEARSGRLISVSVEEGVVALELSGRQPIELGAGRGWNAPPHAASAARSDGADATDSGRASPLAPPERQTAPHASDSVTRRHDGTLNARPSSSRPGAGVAAGSRRDRIDPAVDAAFGAAWALQRAGRYDEASREFDQLLARELGARRADVLFWGAQAHQFARRSERARDLYRELVERYPGAWRAGDARRQLEQLGTPKRRAGSEASGQPR